MDKTNRGEWVSAELSYEGRPLLLRRPAILDFNCIADHFSRLVVIKHIFACTKVNGLPDADENDRLAQFESNLLRYVKDKDGLPVLVETFGGKRSYYFYVAAGFELEATKARIRLDYPHLKLEWLEKLDSSASFIRNYAKEYF